RQRVSAEGRAVVARLVDEHHGVVGEDRRDRLEAAGERLADDPVMLVYKPGDHGSTFGGNPLAAAIAREALKVLIDEKMIDNSAKLGAYFLEKLRGLKSKWIKEVRGKGLWIGLELTEAAGG